MADVDPFSQYAFISIGSNLPSAVGDPMETVRFAFASLAGLTPATLLMSSVYATSPVDSPEGTPGFLNALAGMVPAESETPQSLLQKLQALENEAGRKRSGTPNEARTLDLDMITYKDVILDEPALILPHPGTHERRFVLEPLMEIAGSEFILPGSRKTLMEHLALISDSQEINKV